MINLCDDVDDDDDLELVPMTFNENKSDNDEKKKASKSNNTNEEEDGNDGIQMIYESHNALIDFPHSRGNCMKEKFGIGADIKHCDNCYCYVCDKLASECSTWDKHCSASHGSR